MQPNEFTKKIVENEVVACMGMLNYVKNIDKEVALSCAAK